MSKQQVSCRLIYDRGRNIARWVCLKLGYNADEISDGQAFGLCVGNRLIGGIIYHNIRPYQDLWWTIYTEDKHWCSKKILKQIFGLAFDVYHVNRISLLINSQNSACIKLVSGLGFKKEGCLRNYDNGIDSYIYGMLQSENLWKGKINE